MARSSIDCRTKADSDTPATTPTATGDIPNPVELVASMAAAATTLGRI